MNDIGKMSSVVSNLWKNMPAEQKEEWGNFEDEKEADLTCPNCQKIFKKSKHLKYHKKNCGEFQCETCKKIFKNKNNMLRHANTHNKNHKCDECEKMFSSLQGLQRHNLTHQPYQFECSNCNKTFSQKSNLLRHQKDKH